MVSYLARSESSCWPIDKLWSEDVWFYLTFISLVVLTYVSATVFLSWGVSPSDSHKKSSIELKFNYLTYNFDRDLFESKLDLIIYETLPDQLYLLM